MSTVSREKGEAEPEETDRSGGELFSSRMVFMTDLQPDGDELKSVRVASKKEKAALIQ